MLTLYTFFSKVVKRKKEMFTLRKKSEALAGLFSLIRICWQTWYVFLKIFHSLCLHIHSLSNSFFPPLWASKDPWKHQASMIWAPFGGSAGSCFCFSLSSQDLLTYWLPRLLAAFLIIMEGIVRCRLLTVSNALYFQSFLVKLGRECEC